MRLITKLLREARDDEVWIFVTAHDVLVRWDAIAPHLGRRRAFWEFMFHAWKRQKLVA